MAWAEPLYTRKMVKEAGQTYVAALASREDRELALAIINNWRSAHGFPLNTLQVNLRWVAGQFDNDPTVAQRIKRLPSIRSKLERMPNLTLAQMQDIGGCRAVVSSVEAVSEVVAYYKEQSRIKHRLVREDPYVDSPKASGYRGVHLVYSYNSDKKTTWNGLKIEMQIRSRLQHAWATAVETVGTFTQQALKSSEGEKHWLRFFAVMSSVLARREGTPTVPGTPDNLEDLTKEVRALAKRLGVIHRLRVYGAALEIRTEVVPGTKKATFLLELDITGRSIGWSMYSNPLAAADAYSAVERAIADDPDKDAVLVTVESIDALRRAYPNYFLDTTVFLDAVEEAIA
jgi:hypothetical protein